MIEIVPGGPETESTISGSGGEKTRSGNIVAPFQSKSPVSSPQAKPVRQGKVEKMSPNSLREVKGMENQKGLFTQTSNSGGTVERRRNRFQGGTPREQKTAESFELFVRRPLRANEAKKEYNVTVVGRETVDNLLTALTERFDLDKTWWRLYATDKLTRELRVINGNESLDAFKNQRIYLYPKFFGR